MDLDDLNKSVTHAILQAEAFPCGSWEAQHAFREVADLEEEIATIAGAGVVEGEIARLGAVTAAMSAGEPLRALQLGGALSGGRAQRQRPREARRAGERGQRGDRSRRRGRTERRPDSVQPASRVTFRVESRLTKASSFEP
jgi:hypothetical protein